MGQHPQADFSLPAQGCKEEKIKLKNLSSGATRYEWDLCQGDLALTPTAASVTTLPGSVPTGVDLAFDGTNWFGFVTNQNGNSILRLDFGTDLSSVPVVTNLGNIGGNTNRPTDIKIVTENGNWFGFVYNLDPPFVSRINFGNALTNTATSSSTADVIVGGSGFTNGGFDMMFDGNNWVIVLTNNASFNIVKLPTLSSPTPGVSDKITVSSPNGSGLGDITLQEYNGAFYGYVVAYGSKTLQRLNFSTTLFSTPVIDNISSAFPASPAFTPYGIDGGYDNGKYFLFISTLDGYLIKIDLGSDLSQSPLSGSSLGNLSALGSTIKFRLVKHRSRWFGFSAAWDSRKLFRISFPEPACEFSTAVSDEFEPSMQLPSASGKKSITLRAFKSNGEYDEANRTIIVTSDTSPGIAIGFDSHCTNATTRFSILSSATLSSYSWSFHDMTTSSVPEPTMQYSAAGEYDINVEVTANNGCKNIAALTLSMYDPPVSAFTLPSGLLCTNGENLFTNNTIDNFDGHLSYQWYIGSDLVSTSRDLQYTFLNTGAKTIKLRASIPGCFDDDEQVTSTVQAGPAVDFSFSGICQGTETQFTSLIGETVSSRNWDFDDGGSSPDPDPSHLFPSPGTYTVSLTAQSPSGCNNTKTKSVTIRFRPTVEFSVAPPPKSCNNTLTPFTNLTTDPIDSDIVAWQWNFDDPASPTPSGAKDPSHTFANAGTYNVTLSATTDFGCFGSLQKAIIIAQSPSVAINYSLLCNNLPVNFTSTGNNILTYYWEMGTSYYEVPNPVHTFSTPGDHVVKLVVKGTNLCETTYNKTVSVPVPLVPDFSVSKNCAGTDAIFTDLTTGADVVTQRTWDFGGLGSATTSPALFKFASTGNKNVRLNVTGQSGCSYSATRTVSVVTPPTAGFTATPETGASPLSVQFTNTSANAAQYAWTFGDGTGTSTQVSPTYVFQQTGEFVTTLTATSIDGCESSMSKVIRSVTPQPDVDLRAITMSENTDGTLKVIITLQNNGNTFLKDLPVYVDVSGNVTLREMVPGPIAPSALYNIVLGYGLAPANVNFLCARADLQNDFAPQGNRICTELKEKTSFINPYPNPAKDILNIEWVAPAKTAVSIMLVDAFGKKMLDHSVLSADGLNHYQLDVSGLQGGIYLLVFRDATAVKTQKVFISGEN